MDKHTSIKDLEQGYMMSAEMFRHIADEVERMAGCIHYVDDVRAWFEMEMESGTLKEIRQLSDKACDIAERATELLCDIPYGLTSEKRCR